MLAAGLGGLALLASTAVRASETASEPPVPVIKVTANFESDLRPYKWYLPGVREYHQYQHLAPAAPLRFAMVTPSFPMKPLKISKASLEKKRWFSTWSLPLEVTEDGWFSLPISAEAEARGADVIVSRRNASNARWVIDIHTPTLPFHIYRLGDLRLECRVYLAIEWGIWKGRRVMAKMQSKPVSEPPMDALCGGDSDIFFNTRPWPRLQGYILREGERKVRYELNGLRINVEPLMLSLREPGQAAQPWSDDAQVEFIFYDKSSWVVPPESKAKTNWEGSAP
jgi:hypothetical protein